MTQTTISPRWYQTEAIEAVWDYVRTSDGNPCVELPTGAGKSIVIARLMLDTVAWNGRVVLLAHRKELLEQTADKIRSLQPTIDVGVYSAGLKRRDTEHDVLVAGIQSVYNRADEIGSRDVIIVDEAHLIPTEGDGMFRRFIADAQIVNPNVRVIGLTATPYRLKDGMVCGEENILTEICYSVGVKQLIAQKYLCELTSKATAAKCDSEGVSVRGGEFVASELQSHLTGNQELVATTSEEIIARTADRNSVLVFTSGKYHGKMVAEQLAEKCDSVEYLDGDTDADVRADILDAFKNGDVRYLVNIDVLTTGFDAPNVDCVAMLRPTLSPGLYYQMVGRGFRLHESKSNCLILDFAQNVERHGPVDQVEIVPRDSKNGKAIERTQSKTKVCQKCFEICLTDFEMCSRCNTQFPPPEIKHDAKPTEYAIISGEPRTGHVRAVWYHVHEKRGNPDAPKTLRVDYSIGFNDTVSEWICVEHDGFARKKAKKWWDERCGVPCPRTAAEAVKIAQAGFLRKPDTIEIEPDGKYQRVTSATFSADIPSTKPFDTEGGLSDFVDEAARMFDGEIISMNGVPIDDLPF